MIPKKLQKKLENRIAIDALRILGKPNDLIDFASNDYLGFSKSEAIFNHAIQILNEEEIEQNGATGSRLISGNHQLYDVVESVLCSYHNSEAALIFNSGYDANLGFFSCVPQRGDVVIYDELAHASIRDGIKMSNAKAYKFRHNDLEDFQEVLKRVQSDNSEIYVVTESVFSMDGDSPDLSQLAKVCKMYSAHLIVDEAHAVGVFGTQGKGLVSSLGLQKDVFIRVVTFGKALGVHGAAILGNEKLKQYLVNFSRPLIYTTGLSPHSLATINAAYNQLATTENITKLHDNIGLFKMELERLNLKSFFIDSNSAIQCCIVPGNNKVKLAALKLQEHGFDVRPILSPTVPEGKERLRFCLHSYNSEKEIISLVKCLAPLLKK